MLTRCTLSNGNLQLTILDLEFRIENLELRIGGKCVLHILVVCVINVPQQQLGAYAGINVMEVAELRTAISELLARVERIRDWL